MCLLHILITDVYVGCEVYVFKAAMFWFYIVLLSFVDGGWSNHP